MDGPINSSSREIRGRSAELEGRRINAVPPMHMGESVLQSLWKEHQAQQAHQMNNHEKEIMVEQVRTNSKSDDNDRKLQQMLEKYQSQVKLQQVQRTPTKNTSRNNLHKIEKIASQQRSSTSTTGSSAPHQMSVSQPCLIAISDKPPEYSAPQPLTVHYPYKRRSSGSGSSDLHAGAEASMNGIANQRMPNNQKLIQSLREENLHLKKDAELMKKKLTRMQQIESSYDRLVNEYDSLLREKERQDGMEKNALIQMDMHLKRVLTEKEAMQARMDHLQMAIPAAQNNQQAMEKVNQLNMILADVISQNKDLKDCTDRQKLELNAQSATLEEQRNHIAMLDKALSTAQERLAKREKQCEELSHAAERANMLQRQLHETLLDKQVREETHSTERAQWEMDITQLKMQLNKDLSLNGSLKRTTGAGRLSMDNGDEAVTRLKKTLYSKDERITQLQRTLVELERKLHEESERKKCALGALGESMEAKIRLLEEQKSERDRRIAELTEENQKLGDVLGSESRERGDLYFSRERDEDNNRDLNKMEEIRQRIQDRRRKGRIGATGGLIGIPNMNSDHSRSSSGSLLQSMPTHRRTSSGPFDPSVLASVLNDTPLPPYRLSTVEMSSGGHIPSSASGYLSTVSFNGVKREDENGDSVWNV